VRIREYSSTNILQISIMNIERRQREFDKMKSSVKSKYKNAMIRVSEISGYSVVNDGKNVVSSEWPDLQFGDTVYDAWKNAYITNHWTNQANKRIDVVKNTITNTCGDTSNIPTVESYEYAVPNLDILDEETFNN